jgi:hypothetical protein
MGTPTLHQRDFARTTLKPRHRTLLPKLAEAFFAWDGPISPLRLEAFTQEVDDAISTASKTLRFGLLVMLDVVQLSPLFLSGRLATFEGLPLDDRAKLLTRLERSSVVPLALIFVAWKTLLTMVYFEAPGELMVLGYPGDDRKRYLTVAREP